MGGHFDGPKIWVQTVCKGKQKMTKVAGKTVLLVFIEKALFNEHALFNENAPLQNL